MNRLSILLILLCGGSLAFGQVLNYEVVKGDKRLGEMIVKRTALENRTYYEITSEVTFHLILPFTVIYESTSEYKFGQLIKEYTHSTLSGKTQKKSTIWFDGSKYTLDLDGIRTHPNGPIEYSVAAVYYHEPQDGQRVYSPQFGEFLTFEKTGEHTYELQSPDGKNEYYYTQGICTEVRVYRDFAKFSFVITPESLMAVKQKRIIGSGNFTD